MSRIHRFFAAAAIALCAGAAFAQDPEPSAADLQLDHFDVVTIGEGLARVDAAVRIEACGAAQGFKSSLSLIRDGEVVAQADLAVATDTPGDLIPGKCAVTRNGSCTGVACPDAVVNGERRKGTCTDGSAGYCGCHYGVAGFSFDVAVQEGSRLELVVDREAAVPEASEGNNYGSIAVGGN